MTNDAEAEEVLKALPQGEPGHLTCGNAYVYKDRGRICILLLDGGWLGFPMNSDELQADLAPFSD